MVIEGSVYINTYVFYVVSILEVLRWHRRRSTQRSGAASIYIIQKHLHLVKKQQYCDTGGLAVAVASVSDFPLITAASR